MRDPRLETLATNLLDHSIGLQQGDRLLVEADVPARDLIVAVLEGAYERGAVPFFEVGDPRVRRAWLLGANREQMDLEVGWSLRRLDDIEASIYIIAGDNASEMADVPPAILEASRLAGQPLMDKYLTKKWCLLRYPTPSAAQAAGMSTEGFEDFCLDVSSLDYARMDEAMDPLVELMSRTDRVRIVSPGTDLSFSIKGIPVLKAAGKNNIPDGEVFTGPVETQVDPYARRPGVSRGVVERLLRDAVEGRLHLRRE